MLVTSPGEESGGEGGRRRKHEHHTPIQQRLIFSSLKGATFTVKVERLAPDGAMTSADQVGNSGNTMMTK